VAAAKPVRSPTTPPPSATTQSFLSKRDSPRKASACSSERRDLCCSPSFIIQRETANPAARRLRNADFPNKANTVGFEINATRHALAPREDRACSPKQAIRLVPIAISYLAWRAFTRTVTRRIGELYSEHSPHGQASGRPYHL